MSAQDTQLKLELQNNATSQNVQIAVEDVERITVNSPLLTYYTEMTAHHRTKLSVIGGAYLTLGQLMLLTPIESIKTQLTTHAETFVLKLGCIIALLTLGLCHHAANLAQVAGQRLNVLRNLYWFKLPDTEDKVIGYEAWRQKFEVNNRDSTSVSQPSLLVAFVVLVPVFFIVQVLFYGLTKDWLTKTNNIYVVTLGAFFLTQFVMIGWYSYITWLRYGNFRSIRGSYKRVQSAKSKISFLQENN